MHCKNNLVVTDLFQNTKHRFSLTDQAGNSGFVHFIVTECPGIAPPNPPALDNCSSYLSTLLDIRINNKNSIQIDSEKLFLKPNPVVDKLILDNSELGQGFKIIDISGKEIKSGTIYNNELNVEEIQQGLYFIFITNFSNKITRHGKFVKTD